MEAGGRAMHGAIAENRSVYDIHEEGWPRETLWVFEHGAAAAIAGKAHF